jgi:hypothetical protein
MILTPIRAEDFLDAWPWFSEVIAPAVQQDANATMAGVREAIVNGHDLAVHVGGADARGVMVLQITPDAVCWIKYVAGRIYGGPKARIKTLRRAIAWIEKAAQDAGCKDVRVCGRDWSVVLTDYELIEGDLPNQLRKRLTSMKEAA